MKEKLQCPVCGSRLMDKDVDTKVQVFKATDTNQKLDLWSKCPKCRNIIGIKVD